MKELEFLFVFVNITMIFLIFLQKKSIRNSSFSEKFSQDLTNFSFIEILTTFFIMFNLSTLIYNFVFKI